MTAHETATRPQTGTPGPAAGFASYSRRDAARVAAIVTHVSGLGRPMWIDAAEIAPGSLWRDELRHAIEAADAVICFVSPAWVSSTECRAELDLAVSLGKRLVPVVLAPVDPGLLPGELRAVQWIAVQGRDDVSIARSVIAAMEVDTERVREHTFWLGQALRWSAANEHRSTLARGRSLRAAEAWLQRGGRDPEPTGLQIRFISASRRGERRRSRIQLSIALAAVVVTTLLAVFALVQRNTAIRQRDIAQSRALAVASSQQLSRDPMLALLLARAGYRSAPTSEAESALRAAIDQSLLRMTVHSGAPVDDVMGTGTVLVTAGSNGTLTAWNTAGNAVGHLDLGGPLLRLYPDRTGTAAVALLKSGRAIVVKLDAAGSLSAGAAISNAVTAGISADGTAAVVGLSTGAVDRAVGTAGFTRVLSVRRDERPAAVAVSDDGSTVAVGTGLRSYHQQLPAAGTVFGRFYLRTATGVRNVAVAETPVDRVLLDKRGTVVLYAAEDGNGAVDEVSGGTVRLTVSNAFEVDLDPSGRYAAETTIQGALHLGVLADRSWHSLAGRSSPTTDLRFSADGSLLATARVDGPGQVWSTASGTVAARLLGITDATSVMVTPGDRTVVTGESSGAADVWAVPTPPTQARLAAPNVDVTVGTAINSVDIDRSGSLVLSEASDGVLRMWTPRGAVSCPGGGKVSENGYCPLGLFVAGKIGVQLGLGALARFSPDGQDVAVAASDGSVWLFTTTRIPKLVWHTAAGGGPSERGILAFSPDGARILTQRGTGAPRVLDAATGQVMATLQVPSSEWYLGAWTSDDEVIVGDAGGTTGVYRDDGRLERTLIRSGGAVLAVAGNGAGSAAVAAGSEIMVFDARSGNQTATLSGDTQDVDALAYSADGRFLLSGSLDGTARLWDPSTATTLTTLAAPGSQLGAVGYDDASRTIVAGGQNSTVYFGRCDVCVGSAALAQLAEHRSTRALTAGERAQFDIGSGR